MLLDGDGAFRHWKYRGAYADQPAVDLMVYRTVQLAWNEQRNEEQKQRMRRHG
jgi:hypothetical protein